MNRKDLEIRNEGYLDCKKAMKNTRILVLNPNRCRSSDSEKITIIINSCKRQQIDICCLAEVNTKQTTRNTDKIQYKLKTLEQALELIVSDSK